MFVRYVAILSLHRIKGNAQPFLTVSPWIFGWVRTITGPGILNKTMILCLNPGSRGTHDNRRQKTVKALREWEKYYHKEGMEFGSVPSFYAQESPSEMFAESFVGILKKQNLSSVKKTKQMIELLLKEVKK